MRLMVATVVCGVLASAGTAGAWSATPEAALETPVRVSWSNVKLTDALADLAAQGGIGFVLDPGIPAKARSAMVSYGSDRTLLKVALGRALKAAGLRYTISGGAVWISTPERVASRVVYKGAEDLVEASPMTKGEAMEVLSPQEEAPDLTDPKSPFKHRPKPTVNPVTGLTDFPAPPVFIESKDADNPRFKYTTTPSFLKGEYRTEEKGDSDLLALAIKDIKAHPNWSREEILIRLLELLAAQK
jgi:hypothetical protein